MIFSGCNFKLWQPKESPPVKQTVEESAKEYAKGIKCHEESFLIGAAWQKQQ